MVQISSAPLIKWSGSKRFQAKAIVDYSPVGLAKTLATDVKKLNNSLENIETIVKYGEKIGTKSSYDTSI